MTSKTAIFWQEQLKYLPLQKPLLMNSTTSIRQTLTAMQKKKTSCSLILDDSGKVCGIFTERDLIDKVYGVNFKDSVAVSSVMAKDLVAMKSTSTVLEAVETFSTHRFRHMPVFDGDNQLEGLLSVRVLSDYIAEQLPKEVLYLPPNANQVSKTISGG